MLLFRGLCYLSEWKFKKLMVYECLKTSQGPDEVDHRQGDELDLDIDSKSHLKSNTLVSDRVLLLTRSLIFIFMTFGFIKDSSTWVLPNKFKFFTIWGFTITETYFFLVMFAYVVNGLGCEKS